MSGWIWVVIVLGLLLGIGLLVDWRRRYSSGGHLDGRSATDHHGGHHDTAPGAGCGGGGP